MQNSSCGWEWPRAFRKRDRGNGRSEFGHVKLGARRREPNSKRGKATPTGTNGRTLSARVGHSPGYVKNRTGGFFVDSRLQRTHVCGLLAHIYPTDRGWIERDDARLQVRREAKHVDVHPLRAANTGAGQDRVHAEIAEHGAD